MRVVGLAALAAAVAVAAGCGAGEEGDGRLTKEEFIAAADAICKEANAKLDALGTPTTLEQIAKFAGDAITIQEEALADLKALKPPAADEATINEAYALLDQQLELGRQIEAAAKEGDQAKIQELVGEVQPIDSQADQIAQDYGLKECGND
jgi:hypothetical protein